MPPSKRKAAPPAPAPTEEDKRKKRKEDPNRDTIRVAEQKDVKYVGTDPKVWLAVGFGVNAQKSRLESICDIPVTNIQSMTIRDLCVKWRKCRQFGDEN